MEARRLRGGVRPGEPGDAAARLYAAEVAGSWGGGADRERGSRRHSGRRTRSIQPTLIHSAALPHTPTQRGHYTSHRFIQKAISLLSPPRNPPRAIRRRGVRFAVSLPELRGREYERIFPLLEMQLRAKVKRDVRSPVFVEPHTENKLFSMCVMCANLTQAVPLKSACHN